MNKRVSIASLAPRKANAVPAEHPPISQTSLSDAPAETQEPQANRTAKTPPPYKAILSKVDVAAHRQLKRLAIDEGVPVGDLQIEALNLLFRSRRLPEIAVRVAPDEKGRK